MEGRPRICAPIVKDDLNIIKKVAPLVDLFELRLDLIGAEWEELARELKKPWLACNRAQREGGQWRGSEAKRVDEILKAARLGANIVDIELSTPGVEKIAGKIKGKAECLISYHNLKETPPLAKMREIIQKELEAGADICKLVTTAKSLEDNLAVLQLIRGFPGARVVAFAMGDLGAISRLLCPLVGGYFTYAAMKEGLESAPGQMTVGDLRKIYGTLKNGK